MNNDNGRAPEATPDPFDLDLLRLSQDFGTSLGVKKLLTTIPVRRPDRQWFVRVHTTLRLETAIVELKDQSESYLVSREMRTELPGEIVAKALLLSITRQGLVFFWPIRLPDETGRLDDWNRSAMEAAKHAEDCWVSVKANRHAGAYDVLEATGKFPDPEWPDKPLEELLRIAFRDRLIDTPDHPVVAQLKGRT